MGKITHRLISDEESLAIYPFPFELTVTHRYAMDEESMQLLKPELNSCGSSELTGERVLAPGETASYTMVIQFH